MENYIVELKNFSLKPDHCLHVEVFIPQDCKRFAINLGKDAQNYALHFNPRFNHLGDVQKIIFNSTENGGWKEEKKEPFFPFQEGTDTAICFKFQKDNISIQLPTGNPLIFPLRSPIEEISYLSLVSVQLKSVAVNCRSWK